MVKDKDMRKLAVMGFCCLFAIPSLAEDGAKDGWLDEWINTSAEIGAWTGASGDGCCTWQGIAGGVWSVTGNVAETENQTVSGKTVCAANGGSYAQTGTPSEEIGEYCWCQMTSPKVGSWVLDGPIGTASYCAANCAFNCAGNVRSNLDFRAAVLR